MSRSRWIVPLLLVAASLVAAILVSWPLAVHVGGSMPYCAAPPPGGEMVWFARGDYLQLYYKLWLFRDAVVGPTPLFRDPYKFAYRPGAPPRYSAQLFPVSALFALLSVAGTVPAYNLLFWVSYPLTAAGMYLLARRMSRDRWIGFVTALLFALIPARFVQLAGGHPNGLLAGVVPAIFALWIVGVRGRRPAMAALGSVCLVATAVMEIHLVYYSILASPVVIAASWLDGRERDGRSWSDRRAWLAVVAWVVGCLGAVGYLLFEHHVMLAHAPAGGARTYGDAAMNAARIANLFRRLPDGERMIYPGMVGLAAIAAGALFCLRFPRSRGRGRWLILAMMALAVAGIALSLGPNLRGYGRLREWIPMLSRSRVPARAAILLFTGAGALTAVTLERLLRRAPSQVRAAALAAVVAIAAVDLAPTYGIGISRVPLANAAYDTLGDLPGDQLVLEIPLWPGDSAEASAYLYYVTLSRTPMVNGYSPTRHVDYVRDVFDQLRPINLGEIGPTQRDVLRRLGVTHLILHPEAFPPKVSVFPFSFARDKLRASPFAREILYADPVHLFEFVPDAEPDAVAVTTSIGLAFEAEIHGEPEAERVDDSAASNGAAVVAQAGRWTSIGPGRRIPRGEYLWRVRAAPPAAGTDLQIEIFDLDATPSVALASTVLPAASAPEGAVADPPADDSAPPPPVYRHVLLRFTAEHDERIALRVRPAEGGGDWLIDGAWGRFAAEPDPCPGFEVEEMAHIARETRDLNASGGCAQHAIPGVDPNAALWGGLMRWYPPGRYRATYTLRCEPGPGDRPVVELRVLRPRDNGMEIIASRPVSAVEIGSDDGAYRTAAIEFDLPGETVLDLRAVFTGAAEVWADRVLVERLP